MNVIQGTVDCTPAEIGYSPSRLDAVNTFFSQMIERKAIHGVSYRLARHGKVFAAGAIGSRHYKDPTIPMLPDSVFQVASVTKSFTSAAIQILVEDGLLAIHENVAQHLPQFDGAPYNEITLFHLLTHTSGLYSSAIPDKHHMGEYAHIREQFEKDGKNTDWIAAGLRSGLRRPPGVEWQYSSFGMMVLGAVIEKVTGVKAEDFIMERICKPLGMLDTGFFPTPDMAKRAIIFDDWSEKLMGMAAQGQVFDDGMWDILPGTAGSLISTTSDLTRFAIMLQQWGTIGDTRILGRKAIESMATQRLHNVPDFCWGAKTPERHYGLGLDMRRFTGTLTSPGTYFHEGSGHCVMIIDPVEELVCVCVYPWVNDFSGDCNNRLYNVVWSGLV